MYEHINSHQNEHIEDKNLAWKAILIWEANILASTYLVETSPHYLQPISAAKIQVTMINNTTINNNYHWQLHYHAQHHQYWKFLSSKYKFKYMNKHDIVWKHFQDILKLKSTSLQTFSIKWKHNLLLIHKTEHKINCIHDPQCVAKCGCLVENH